MLLSLGWIIFSGCTTTRHLSIEVLVPPDTLVYPGLQSATLVSRNALIETSDSLFGKNPDSLICDTAFRGEIVRECLRGFRELLELSTGIYTVIQDTVVSGILGNTPAHTEDTVIDESTSTLCSNARTDVVVILEGVYASDTLLSSWIYQSGNDDENNYEVYRYFHLAVILGAKWSVYDVPGGKKLDQYLYVDTLIWSTEAQPEYDNRLMLPEPKDAFLEAFYWAGSGYGKRIVSTWEETDRFYYCTRNKQMKLACLEASNNRWREAAIIWKELTDHEKNSLAAKAAFNMALVCELEDKLDLAQSWIIKSYLLDRTWAVQNYLDIINYRIFVKKNYDF